MIKNITSIIAAFAISTMAVAAETYTIILPNPAGSSSDVVARTIAEEYNQQTGNTLVLDYAPGGEHLVAVNKFKNRQELTVILGTTTMHVFNHVYKKDLPYGDKEFSHVGWIGWSPHVYYVSADSKLKSLGDFKSLLAQGKLNVGVDALSTQANIISLQKFNQNGSNAQMIKYKGSPQTLTEVLGGHIPVAVSSVSGSIVAQAEAGKIRILGTTNDKPITVNGQSVPAAAEVLGVNQFNGGFLISVNSEFADSDKAKKLKADLLKAIRSDNVRLKLAKINIQVDGREGSQVLPLLQSYRVKLKELN